jgi:hypothetical protein
MMTRRTCARVLAAGLGLALIGIGGCGGGGSTAGGGTGGGGTGGSGGSGGGGGGGTTTVGWTNRTTYVSTRATPFSAVYDPVHQMIYVSNLVWNQIEVISDAKRQVVKVIPIRDPRGMDLSIDGKEVWVTTGSQVMVSIDTTSYEPTQYIAPSYGGQTWEGNTVYCLADGTLLLGIGLESEIGAVGIWSPTANAFTQSVAVGNAPWGTIGRSGDGTKVFSLGTDSNGTSFVYDVATKTLGAPVQLPNAGNASEVAANANGSNVASANIFGLTLLDGNLTTLGTLAGDGGFGSQPIVNLLWGGFVFSADGTKIYEETESTAIPELITIDVASLQETTAVPGMPVIPVMTELSPLPAYVPYPFAVDALGLVLGIEYHGIAFDDPAAQITIPADVVGALTDEQHTDVYSGPLAGGTQSGEFGNAFTTAPNVYYGATEGKASVSSGELTITSPAASAAGPVDVKMLFADSDEVFDPQFFTYGTLIQDAIISGGTSQGGVAAQLDAFGLPLNPSQDTVTIGGAPGTVTSTTTQYPPFTGEQSAMFLSYTTPAGSPGWADVTVQTPSGSGTLAKSFLFAKSVTDYAMTDSATYVLYDSGRNQLYLSAGNHIDVFSLSSLTFSSPLTSPVSGSQFEGLALTPGGTNLLAADLTNGAVAVIDPDTPASGYEIPLPGSTTSYFCAHFGPLYAVADNQGNALIASGTVIGPGSCESGPNSVYIANLAAKTGGELTATGCQYINPTASYLSASRDGSVVAMTNPFAIYSPAQHSCIPTAYPKLQLEPAVSGNGNAIGLDAAIVSPAGNLLGRMAYPMVLYPGASNTSYDNFDPYRNAGALERATLNDSGSLYYWAYPSFIDIVDVQHGLPALRFGLTETVTNTVSPMAIDSSGQHIYLITNQGLTIVDLGSAPLSIGALSSTNVVAGAQITVSGSGFVNGMTATVGGMAAVVALVNETTIQLTIPATPAGPKDLVLQSPDGETYTLNGAVVVQ